jgi:hypothetical protein
MVVQTAQHGYDPTHLKALVQGSVDVDGGVPGYRASRDGVLCQVGVEEATVKIDRNQRRCLKDSYRIKCTFELSIRR